MPSTDSRSRRLEPPEAGDETLWRDEGLEAFFPSEAEVAFPSESELEASPATATRPLDRDGDRDHDHEPFGEFRAHPSRWGPRRRHRRTRVLRIGTGALGLLAMIAVGYEIFRPQPEIEPVINPRPTADPSSGPVRVAPIPRESAPPAPQRTAQPPRTGPRTGTAPAPRIASVPRERERRATANPVAPPPVAPAPLEVGVRPGEGATAARSIAPDRPPAVTDRSAVPLESGPAMTWRPLPGASALPSPEPPPAPPEPEPEAVPARLPVPVPSTTDDPSPAETRAAIDRLVRAYERAYEQRDVAAVSNLWPSSDTDGLTRAFGSVKEQTLTFSACQVTLSRDRGIVECPGVIRYVRRVGGDAPQTRHAVWTLHVARSSNRWHVEDVVVR